MAMKTIKVADATNIQLDWLVAKCEGATDLHFNGEFWIVSDPINGSEYLGNLDYTGDWSLTGPLIEREGMHIDCLRTANHYRAAVWEAWPYEGGTKFIQQAPTPLIAVARCYVSSVLGETAEVPEELT